MSLSPSYSSFRFSSNIGEYSFNTPSTLFTRSYLLFNYRNPLVTIGDILSNNRYCLFTPLNALFSSRDALFTCRDALFNGLDTLFSLRDSLSKHGDTLFSLRNALFNNRVLSRALKSEFKLPESISLLRKSSSRSLNSPFSYSKSNF